MKQIWKEILMAILMGMILPGILLNYAVEQRQEIPKETVAQLELAQPVAKVSIPMKLRQRDGTVTEMDMDEYLAGVVLAELPASFELEAKKAQAVAARTFTLKASLTGESMGTAPSARILPAVRHTSAGRSICQRAELTGESPLRKRR